MLSISRGYPLDNLLELPGPESISGWEDISKILTSIRRSRFAPLPALESRFLRAASQGTAFLTYEFGIDGVSIEIAKYARALEAIYGHNEDQRLHFISGDFSPQADRIMNPRWIRHQIEGINGWQKWSNGEWFQALYLEDMPASSQRSSDLAREIYRQAVGISHELGRYLPDNEIHLLVPVNIASNPGNMALTLAVIMVTEALGTVVINSNHDFYWDGGKPAVERDPEEEPGIRDHFFRNIDNKPFFSLFQKLYPWDGRRWLQVNINNFQSQKLVQDFRFSGNKVRQITTSVGSKLFEDYTDEDVKAARLRMAYILSGGKPLIRPMTLDSHLEQLDEWMEDQQPLLIGARKGLTLDITEPEVIYLLQPTRVIARKRIERGLELIITLLQGPLSSTFEEDSKRRLVLHVTGPTPVEHQEDLEIILNTYEYLITVLPPTVAERVFLAFSVGEETHPSFDKPDFDDLEIADIYRMANVILFPSEIEGRGLPIIESAAVGVPIICSRFRPEDVFADVIGEDLPKDQQIRFLQFPEGDFSEEFLQQAAALIQRPEDYSNWREHNRQAIQLRYSKAALREGFQKLIMIAYQIST